MAYSIAVLTISDTRTADTDSSGQYLVEALQPMHTLFDKQIVTDDKYQIRAQLSHWIADAGVQAIITTGGTGLTARDITVEAITPLLDKMIEGFGELFRALSYEEIGTSTLQSRVFAGIANKTVIFCLPGSTNACRTGWEKLIQHQLNADTRPCNLAMLIDRL